MSGNSPLVSVDVHSDVGPQILVVESDPGLAAELTAQLRRLDGVSAVLSVETLEDAQAHICAGEIDIVVFDPVLLDDPVVDGECVLDSPKLSCVFFSSLDAARLALARTRIGVAGVVERNRGIKALCDHVAEIFEGQTDDKVPLSGTQRNRRVLLSRRERQAAQCLGQGYTLKETAVQMKINPKTVETYKSRALAKLGVSSRAELVGLVAFGRFPDPS
ncbi:response regulator transcription factor [Fontisubflavum oceani]|uniref:response regulator transcription factor n=1 Tax=Fontisubflavum oceani TaxID=2978973 RepID=UPI0025B48581|nr:response regulator transcription factor [Fontisubflavum oceani]WJY20254.1 response regulator transcription factor [Fontisubflavum oceani]